MKQDQAIRTRVNAVHAEVLAGKVTRDTHTVPVRLRDLAQRVAAHLWRRMRGEVLYRIYCLMGGRLRKNRLCVDSLILKTRDHDPFSPSLSHWADWSLSRYGFAGDLRRQPRIVFIKADSKYLKLFLQRYLPLVKPSTRFVLITGDADVTLPRQTDLRFPSYQETGFDEKLLELSRDPRLLHWYAENLDTFCQQISPIPLGYLGGGGDSLFKSLLDANQSIPIRERQFKALCTHRLRQGPQWQKRHDVTRLAQGSWRQIVDYKDNIPEAEFFDTLQRYPFVLCVGGGGLDPSPKAWMTLLAGAIPVMETNPTTMGYEDLPVVFIEAWNEETITAERMRNWLEELSPWFEDPKRRRQVLERMSMGHWLRRIHEHLERCNTVTEPELHPVPGRVSRSSLP